MSVLRLSEHELSQSWLSQFDSGRDQALAAQLLDNLLLVSSREFETGVQQKLIDLQCRLKERISVYPVAPPMPRGIVGYDPFEGAIGEEEKSEAREAGRRRKFGSEDRVGHLLAKLQEQFRRPNGTSPIECAATLAHLSTQGIRHIVLVDDLCGSGKRITDFWKSVPRRVKSLLSLKKCELWILVYAISPAGISKIKKKIPNFPLDHLISVLSIGDLKYFDSNVVDMCKDYGQRIGMKSASLGYRDSACSIVFEHGCPNNVPAILWSSKKLWAAIFPFRAIPHELRYCFDGDGNTRVLEVLWRSGQGLLALSILDALNRKTPLSMESRILLILLGLRMRGVAEETLHQRLLIDASDAGAILDKAKCSGLYDESSSIVTPLGQELVERFRQRFRSGVRKKFLGKSPSTYYPSQCEGIISGGLV